MKNLTISEEKLRDLYLRGLAIGKIQGPPTGKASIDKPWLKYYSEKNIISDIPKLKAYDYLLYNNYNNLDKTALNYFGIKISYKELIKNIDKVAKALKENNVKSGDVVTLAMANTPETIYVFYALNRLGAICNVIDPRYSPEEMKREINLANSELVLTLDMAEKNIEKIINETDVKKVVSITPVESLPLPLRKIHNMKNGSKNKESNSTKWRDFLKEGKNGDKNIDSEYIENTPIALVHTGGTTGEPKGVLLTNENFVSMAHMHKNGGLNYTKDDKFLNILPPFIAYCLCNGINMPLSLGLEVTLIPQFDAKDFPDLLNKYKPNHVLAGPILWEYVMKSDIDDLSYLKTPVSGGDVLNKETELKINEFFENKGCKYKVAQGYGMTEVSSAASFSIEEANMLGSVGIPFLKNTISVFDPDTYEEKYYDEEGEIWISTPTEMLKYYNNDNATNTIKTKSKDGKNWIRTSDIGKITKDGNIIIVGRMKRMIVRNGSKIFPSNVENIILQNKNIDQCAIVAMKDEIERNVPVAHIVLSENSDIDKEKLVGEIENIILENLPEFNIPTKYIFRREMPLTGINKIDFKQLEQEEFSSGKIIDLNKKNTKIYKK